MEIMAEIENACHIKFTAIANNSNLGELTTEKTVLDSLDFIERLSLETGLPIWMHTAEKSVAEKLSAISVMPMTLQKKIF